MKKFYCLCASRRCWLMSTYSYVLKAISSSLFLVLFSTMVFAQQSRFPTSGKDFMWYSSGNGTTTRVWKGNQDGTFTICPTEIVQSSAFNLDCGDWGAEGTFAVDLNKDGITDILHRYEGYSYINAYMNNGLGVYTNVQTTITDPTGQMGGQDGTEFDGILDVNGDGYPDYANVNDDVTPNVQIYLNTSSTLAGTFAKTAISFNLENSPGSGSCTSGWSGSQYSTFADLNNDGKPDLLVTTNRTIYVYLGSGSGSTFRFGTLNGDGRYDPNYTMTVPGSYTWTGLGGNQSTFVVDVTGDGIPDYVFGYSVSGGGILVFPGIGNGKFTIPVSTTASYKTLTVPSGLGTNNFCGHTASEGTQLVDVNNDGILDWVFTKDDAGSSSGIYVWLGTGSGTTPFNTTAAITLTSSPQTSGNYAQDGEFASVGNILTSESPYAGSTSPGGVSKGLSMWLRADSSGSTLSDGSAVSTWKNKALLYNAVQSTTANEPIYHVNEINYNPAMVFNGTNTDAAGSYMIFSQQQTDIRSAFWEVQDLATDQDYDQVIFGIYPNNDGSSYFHSGAGYLEWSGAGLTGTNIWHLNGLPCSYNQNYDYGPTGKPDLVSVVTTTECVQAGTLSYQQGTPTRKWNGPMSEVILYSRALTTKERLRIESYMAVKYGSSLDQTTAQSYIASDSTTIFWNATTNGTYKNNIAGIGRDDASGLNQKQSRSVNNTGSGNMVAMGLGSIATTNQLNTNTFGANKSFLMWSDDGASITPVSTTVTGDGTTNLPTLVCGSFRRMGRTWRVSKTGTVGTVQLQFILGSVITMGTNINDFYLAINNSNTFGGTVTKMYAASAFAGNTVTFNSVSLSDGQYFTLIGRKSYAPGNVTSGFTFWAKADDGITLNGSNVSLWTDQSTSSNSASQSTVSYQPAYLNSKFNFNPALYFSGGQMLLLANTISNANYKLFSVGLPTNTGTWNTMFRNTISKGDHFLIVYPSTPYLGYYDQNYGFRNSNITLSYALPSMMNMFYTTSTGQLIPSVNGKAGTTLGTITYTAGNDDLYTNFGSYADGQAFGYIGEVVVYNSTNMSTTDIQKVQSYLGIKWGLTIDQTTATDYIASDGTTFWSATANSTFKKHIAGIGRDDCSDLLQKQSQSSDTTSTGNMVTMGLGTISTDNYLNTGIFTADKNFLMWADNGNSTIAVTSNITTDSLGTALTGGCGVFQQCGRTWRVSETGSVPSVQIQINLKGILLGNNAANMYLAVNTSSTFGSTVTKLYPASSYSNNVVTFNNVTFRNGEYFTVLGAKVHGPANITSNLKLWLKADDQALTNSSGSVYQWYDHSAQAKILITQGWTLPGYTSVGQNFNPIVTFNGGQGIGLATGMIGGTTDTGANVFCVVRPNSTSLEALFQESLGTGGQIATYVPYGSQILMDEPSNQRLAYTVPSTVVNYPALWTLYSANNSQIIYQNGKSVQTATAASVRYVGNSSQFGVGVHPGVSYWNGNISELIVYSHPLTLTQQQIINSYLSIKWGISMDQTSATNYLASNGSTIWNASTNGTFKYHITGIGRDDCSEMQQLQSRNIDTSSTGWVTMGLGTIAASNAANPDSFGKDKTFLIWSDNNASSAPVASAVTGDGTTSLTATCGSYYKQLGRTWRVSETGTATAVQVQVNVNNIALGNVVTDFYLAVNSSSTFSGTITKLYPANSYVNGVLTFNSIKFTDGQYFTVIGAHVQGPGGVASNIAVWLKADAGVTLNGTTVSQLNDQSNGGYNVSQATTANQPTYNNSTNLINFNPSISFTGSSVLTNSTGILGTGSYTGMDIFSVTTSQGTSPASGVLLYQPTASNYLQVLNPWSNNYYYLYVNGNASYALTTNTQNTAYLSTYTNTGNVQTISNNGKQLTLAAGGTNTSAYTGTSSAFSVGDNTSGNYMNGRLGELVVYTTDLTATQKLQVNSYLALKWGISIDQTTATNYVNSSGTAIWNGTTNSTYKYRITGIGRDDCSTLNQLQSCSQDTTSPGYVTMGLGTIASTNAANPDTFGTDKTYLIWGDDGVSGTTTTAVTGDGTTTISSSCAAIKRLAKTFKVQTTGTPTAVQVSFNMNGVTLGSNASSFYLAVNSSATFSGTVTKLYAATSYTNNVVTFNNVTLSNGQYFILIGKKILGPAGITTGIAAWYRADDGSSSGSAWYDYSDNLNTAVQATSSKQPTYISAGPNYNPTFSFNGSSDNFASPSLFTSSGTNNINVYAVSVARQSGTVNELFGEVTSNGYAVRAMLPNNNAYVYWDAPYGYRIDTVFTGSYGIPYVWSMLRSATNMAMYSNHGRVVSVNGSYTNIAGNSSVFNIGYNAQSGSYMNGKVSELIVFNNSSSITATQRQQIESYLAIKYGASLNQSTATNYLASDASVIWNASTNGSFKYRITGIGRDDCSELYQKQSINGDTTSPGYVAMGLGSVGTTNTSNSGQFVSDKNFLFWADNNVSANPVVSAITGDSSGTTLGNGNCGVFKQSGRTWRISATGSIPYVEVKINLTNVSQLGLTATDFYLAVNYSSTFSGTVHLLYPATSYTNNIVTFDNVSLKNGQYFTIVGQRVIGPGGVASNIALWLKADSGIALNGSTVSTWRDQSGNAYNLSTYPSNPVTSFQPTYYSTGGKLLNYNPTLYFNGSNILGNANRLYLQGSSNTIISAYVDDNTSSGAICTPVCIGDNGNYPAPDVQNNDVGDGYNRFNPWTDYNGEYHFGTSTITIGQQIITGVAYQNNVAGTFDAWLNGAKENTNTSVGGGSGRGTTLNMTGANAYEGKSIWAGTSGGNQNTENLTGRVSEIVIYTSKLRDGQIQRINSYLALKYGITMTQVSAPVGSVTPPTNAVLYSSYIASDSTVIWDASVNSTYKNHITGIGRDDCSSLYQKQSRNADTTSPGYVAMGLGSIFSTNAANTDTFGNDKTFLVWADDGVTGTAATTVSTDGITTITTTNCGILKRLGKTFKVQETQTVTAVQVKVNVSGVFLGNTASSFYLAVNSSNTFGSTVTKLYSAASYANNVVTFNNVTFTNGQYFTVIGTPWYGPAGVTSNISMWLRADSGIGLNSSNVNVWRDQSGNNISATQSTSANQPAYNSSTSLQNFNPTLYFNGSSDVMSLSAPLLGTGNQLYTIYSVVKPKVVSSAGAIYSEGASTTNEIITAGFNSSSMFTSYYSNDISSGTVTASTPYILRYSANGTNRYHFANGLQLYSGSIGTFNKQNSTEEIGNSVGATQYLNGYVSELIVYNGNPTSTQSQEIESYLGIKYGITMNQSSATNYLASNGTVIWNATTNATYKNRITGIGRDDCSHLYQKQSINQDTTSPGYVTIGLGTISATNAANPDTFGSDKTYLLWGDNGTAGVVTSTVTGDGTITITPSSCAILKQLAKTYAVQTTGTVSALQVQFNLNQLLLGNAATSFYLAVNSSSTFSGTITKLYAASSYANNTVTFSNVTLTNGEYFTLIGKKILGPAGVTSNISAWFKGDGGVTASGTSVQRWSDQSDNINDGTQATSANEPTYNTSSSLLNFNPTLYFNGSSDYLSLTSSCLGTGNQLYTIYSVVKPKVVSSAGAIYSEGTGSTNEMVTAGFNSSSMFTSYYSNDISSGAVTASTPCILRYSANGTNRYHYADGLQLYSGTVGSFNKVNGTEKIGNSVGATQYLNGFVSELVIYNGNPTTTQSQEIESYLAIKYGITMNQSSATNYLASNGTIIWNATTYSTYSNRITGIGRDDCSELNQKQSRNIDTTNAGYVTMGLGTIASTNAANPDTFGTDKTFLVWGDNGTTGISTTTVTGDGTINITPSSCGVLQRLAKTYAIEETGTVTALQVQVNLTGLTLASSAANLYLAVNSSATFSGTITKLYQASSYTNNIATFSNVHLSNGQYFTVIGAPLLAPAGVTSNISMWLRADSGISVSGSNVTAWRDQSNNGITATQSTSADQPVYNTSSYLQNFNPTLYFNGSSDVLSVSKPLLGTGNQLYTIYSVVKPKVVSSAGAIYSEGAPSANEIVTAGFNSSSMFTSYYSNDISSGAVTASTPYILRYSANGTNRYHYANDVQLYSGTVGSFNKVNGTQEIGNSVGATQYLNGYVSELVVYNGNPTATQSQEIESYLAIKYGISMNQSSATNYLSSNGTVLWNATTNATYNNRVTGIGRDDCSALYQKQSRNQDTTNAGYITIGLSTVSATNAANPDTFGTDKTFLLWGDDGVTSTSTTTVTGDGTTTITPPNCAVLKRLGKTYKVQTTGTVGALQVQANLNYLLLGNYTTSFYLAVNSSATFSGTVTKIYTATSFANNIVTFNNVHLSNGQYFIIIGKRILGPASVTSNIAMWLRPDGGGVTAIGGDIAQWSDQSANFNDVSQATTASQPPYNTSSTLINFNPTVSFNGSSYLSKVSGILGSSTYNGSSAFVISQNNSIQNSAMFYEGTSVGQYSAYIPYGDSKVYWNCGNNSGLYQLFTSWGGSNNVPYLWSMTYNTSTPSQAIYRNGLSISSKSTASSFTGNNSPLYIGTFPSLLNFHNAVVGDIVIYTAQTSASDKQKIESYLAVKYGLTLDQTSATNYYASDWTGSTGTTIWNASTNGAYKYNVTGIGRDDCSELVQLQSQSINTTNLGNMVTIGLKTISTTNASNPATFGADKSYLMWSDTSGHSTPKEILSGLPPQDVLRRLDRQWRVSVTGTVGKVQVKFNLNGITQSGTSITDFNLVINSSGDFTSGTLLGVYSPTSYSGGIVTFDSIPFTDGTYFTLGTQACVSLPLGLITSGSAVSASAVCTKINNFQYYFDPASPTKLLFSINHDPQSLGNNNFTATVSLNRPPKDSALDKKSAATQNGNFLMPRYWNVHVNGSMPNPVNVRFYYDTTELTNAQARAQAWATKVGSNSVSGVIWFKTVGVSFDSSQVTTSSINTQLILTPASQGTEQGIHYVEFDNVASFSGGTAGFLVSNPLPIHLSSFTVTDDNCQALLNWRTETEQNTNYFAIEMSYDGNSWETIGTAQAQGNSTTAHNYSFEYLPQSTTCYFRLREVDNNNAMKYTNIITFHSACYTEPVMFKLYPNPTENSITATFTSGNCTEAILDIVDMYGRKVMNSITVHTQKGQNTYTVDVSRLVAGMYMIKLHSDCGTQNASFIKMD